MQLLLTGKTTKTTTGVQKNFVDDLNLNNVFLADDETYVESG
jgi:hypothetical protein